MSHNNLITVNAKITKILNCKQNDYIKKMYKKCIKI